MSNALQTIAAVIIIVPAFCISVLVFATTALALRRKFLAGWNRGK